MAVIVEWSEQAASSLEEIFGYHKKEAGVRVARKIATKITQRTRILSDNPLAWTAGRTTERLIGRIQVSCRGKL